MLSRFFKQSGMLIYVEYLTHSDVFVLYFFIISVLSSRSSPIIISQRFISTPKEERAEYTMLIEETKISEETDPSKVVAVVMDNHTPKPLPFNGPQRDYKNFPDMVMPDEPVKSRLTMFPESWFKFLYPKLGVTGMWLKLSVVVIVFLWYSFLSFSLS